MKEIVLLASGSGSNVENIISYFEGHLTIKVCCVLTNNPNAKVIERCKRLQVPLLYFNRSAFSKSSTVLQLLKSLKPSLIVLAGFLWKIPKNWITAFPNQIINIHPALLPKYGGKGMYGIHVHEAVKANHEKETGITIHYINEHYDEGAVIFQSKARIEPNDSIAEIAHKVHVEEHKHFPKVIEKLLVDHG
ncbi:MAG: phosphoribosylglycinamide formyltransferase [Bacteroidota bacterium]